MENNKYTAADFERYHSGQMSEREMHALEKEALKDPFLAEALEGYVFTGTPVKDIDELKERLFTKRKKKNIFFIVQKGNIWLRIAALFILVAGIIYLSYFLAPGKQDTIVAKNDAGEQKVTAPPITKTDSTANSKEQVATVVAPDQKGRSVNKAEQKLNIPQKTNTGTSEARKVTALANKNIQSVPALPSTKNADEDLKKSAKDYKRDMAFMKQGDKNLLEGKVVNSENKPIPNATIASKDKKFATLSDSAGNFKFRTGDTVLTAMISAPGYVTKKKMLGNNNEQVKGDVIVMEHDERKLEDVVVIGQGVQKQKKEIGYSSALPGKVQGLSVSDSVMAPIAGLQKFNEYIQANINRGDDQSSHTGDIVLSFEVNKKGTPKKIRVERSLCSYCDSEAIRLLQNGPKWKYIKDKRSRVTIRF